MIEIIASSLQDALAIERGGADRIELVSALSEGGYTPSIGLVQAILDRVKIPIAVMLRPNRQDFYYANHELEILRRDAVIFNQVGVKHVVMGILSPDGLPDVRRMEQVLDGTSLKLTFHRAIDESRDLIKSVEYLNNYDRVSHILTSGGPGKALDNLDTVKAMIQASHKRIIVGSGVDHTNLPTIRQGLAGLDYDLHAGSAVRGGDVRGEVSAPEVKDFVLASQTAI